MITAEFPDDDDAERWARIRLVASLIPDDVDLSQPHRVALALLGRGCLIQDFASVFDDAMARALVNRLAEQDRKMVAGGCTSGELI